MNRKKTEYIALYLLVFGAILLLGILVRWLVLLGGMDEFSATVAFFATVVVLSALYISFQMILNEFLLQPLQKFLLRFRTFQQTEVVEEENVALVESTPRPLEYEVLRANVLAEQERASQAKLDRVLDYTRQTMVAYMSEEDLECLCGYITEYSLRDTLSEYAPLKTDAQLKSIDIMHFGWNIGKAFGKPRLQTAAFIKKVFAHTLRDSEISTIERKMSHTETECRIKLNGKIL
ncbi:mobilization protein [Odoribacter lunatus]|uniref:mobilization protein n=1 Tax=Odoribacter lunatus TaxID=2941335 RepID=UPI00203C15C6|nr:mobilization protein [Odoribacter lunatus]